MIFGKIWDPGLSMKLDYIKRGNNKLRQGRIILDNSAKDKGGTLEK